VSVRRLVNLAGFALCAALIAYALYSQFRLGLEPCPLCIFQRIGVALLGVVFTGSGECAVVNWRFLGLTMPAWVLIWAFALGTAGVIANLRSSSDDPTVKRRFAHS